MGKATIPPPLRGTSLYTREALGGDASIAPYTQPCGGCRVEHCSPAGSCVVAKLQGRTVFAPYTGLMAPLEGSSAVRR